MNSILQSMLAFYRRYPFVISCCTLLILLGVANYFIWRSQQELAAGHETLQRSGEEMLQALTGHGRVTTELAAVKKALAFIDQNLINEGDLPQNLGYFYQLETASRIRLSSLNQLSSMPTAPEQHYKTVPFTITTTGSYRQILRFLHELESGPRLGKIQNYSLTQAGFAGDAPSASSPGGTATVGPTGPVQVTLNLTLEVLAQP